MNKLYAWIGTVVLLAQIPLTFMIFTKDIYAGACYLAILLLYLLEVCTNVKLRMERSLIYREGMADGVQLLNDVQARCANGEDLEKAAEEGFRVYENKFVEKG